MTSCGGKPSNGDTTIKIFGGNLATSLLDDGIIVYSYNTLDGTSHSYSINDDSAGVIAFEMPNGPSYRFFAIGAKVISGGSTGDYSQLYCGVGINGAGGEYFNLDGTNTNIDFTLSQIKCDDIAFNAVQFQTPSAFNKVFKFDSCLDVSTISTFTGEGCSTGNMGSYRVQHVAHNGPVATTGGAIVFESPCYSAGSTGDAIPAGNGLHPFFTRVIGYVSDSACSASLGTKQYSFPLGLGSGGVDSNVQSDTTTLRIFMQD